MKPGPRPDPLETRRAKGNLQRRPMPANAPGPFQGALTCPAHLAGLGRVMWHEASAWMTAAGTIDPACGPALERYSVAYGRWRQAEAELAQTGMMLTAKGTGSLYPSPWLFVARAEALALLRLEGELGFGASARSRVTKADLPQAGDSGEKFLRDREGWARLQVMTQKK